MLLLGHGSFASIYCCVNSQFFLKVLIHSPLYFVKQQVPESACTSYISLMPLVVSADSRSPAGIENLPSQPENKLTAINTVRIP